MLIYKVNITQENFALLRELRAIQLEIEAWFQKESEKILLQSRCDEISMNEKVHTYHHELHKKHLKKSSILKLETDRGLLEGNAECASFLEGQEGDLLLNPAVVDQAARDFMLGQVEKVFTDQDNQLFLSLPNKKDVKEVLADSNLLAAPGTDGIPSLL